MRLVRIYFTKKDEAAYFSHLDLQRVMARALRRSGLPVWYSQGFNPHIYMTFSLPLPLMQHSLCETMDCKTEDEREDFSEFIAPLNAALPKGITVSAIGAPVYPANAIASAAYTIRYPDTALLEKAVKEYNSAQQAPVVRRTKRSEQTVDLKEVLPSIETSEGSMEIRLPAGGTQNYNPELLTRFLEENSGIKAAEAYVLRTAIYTAEGELFR